MKTNTNTQPLWTASFIKICLVNFFVFVNFHALLPTFPFFVTHLGGDAVAIGAATALFSVASILSRPFVGWFTDTKGRLAVLIFGLIGMAALPMGYFVSAGVAMAVIFRTLHGAFHAASSNATSTWVTDIVPPQRMGEGLGMYGLSMAISTAVAPALGLAVMNKLGFNALFIVATVAAILALVIGVSISDRSFKPQAMKLDLKQLIEPMAVPASITQFFFMMTYGVLEVYVAIYASENGLPSGGLYFIAVAVATVLTRILMGRAVDKYGEAPLVYGGNAAALASILLLVLVHNPFGFIVSALLAGFSFGAVQPSLQTMAMHAVKPERRGAASSTFFIAFDFGIALGGFLAGLLVKSWGYDTMFIVIAMMCVLSTIFYFFFGRNHASSFNAKNRKESIKAVQAQNGENLPLVITISREYGSGGHEIGKMVAESLGIKLYDKQIIEMTAAKSGLTSEAVAQSEQRLDSSVQLEDEISEKMFQAQSEIIREAAHESCVIVGRLANEILSGRKNTFNVFVYADKDARIERISTLHHCSKSDAEAEIKLMDKRRSRHQLHFTGSEWGKRENYDLMISSSSCGLQNAADTIVAMSKSVETI